MKYTAAIILNHMDAIGKGACGNFATLQNTYNSAIHCINNNVEGDFVECGVAYGSQIAAIGLACKVREKKNTIWAFDSYEGIPLGLPGKDTSQPGIGFFDGTEKEVEDTRTLLVSSGISASSVTNVQNNLKRWGVIENNYKFIKGWFQDTLPVEKDNIEKISLLRLDGDLYESTKVCLEYLFPKLVSGGILIIDDWALTGCKLACDEYFTSKKIGGYNKHLHEINNVNGEPNSGPVWFVKK